MSLLAFLVANQALQLVESVGREYLSTTQDAQKATEVLLPIVTAAIKKETVSKEDLIAFLDKADNATLQHFLNAPASADPQAAINEGESVLSNILHIAADRTGLINKIASHSGLPAMLVTRLLPVVATLAVGAVSKQVTAEQRERIRHSIQSPSGGGGFLSIFTSIFSRPSATHAGTQFLGTMIESGVSHEEPWVKEAFGGGD